MLRDLFYSVVVELNSARVLYVYSNIGSYDPANHEDRARSRQTIKRKKYYDKQKLKVLSLSDVHISWRTGL